MSARRERGSIFILALAGTLLLAAALAALAATQRSVQNETMIRLDREAARRAAMSGVQRAMAELAEGVANQSSTATGGGESAGGVNISATTLADAWATFGNNGDEEFTLDRGSFRLSIVDASSKLNVNNVTETELGRLPLTQDQIDSLLDFRGPDREARPQGAKDEYYNGLPKPYNAALRRFETVDELLLVKEWTPDTLYRPQTNVSSVGGTTVTQDGETPVLATLFTAGNYSTATDAAGNAKINVNAANQTQRLIGLGFTQAQVQVIAARQNWTMAELVRTIGTDARLRGLILDNLTTSAATRPEGLINLNTAPEAVLLTVGLTTDVANGILDRQSQGFTRVSELADVPGVTTEVLASVAGRVSVSSNTFLVRVEGRYGRIRYPLEVVVDVNNGRPRMMQVLSPPFADMTTLWGWNEAAQTTTELGLAR